VSRRHHSICTVVPPHTQRHIAEHGGGRASKDAARTIGQTFALPVAAENSAANRVGEAGAARLRFLGRPAPPEAAFAGTILEMKTHEAIDRRSLAMARRIVAKIDADPQQRGFAHAREVCARWVAQGNVPAREWMTLLERSWPEVRALLLDESDEGQRLRQSDPFCGILTPAERWEIYREAARDEEG
jgi:hypothetical protein